MEILFAGICLFADDTRKPGKVAIFPNGKGNGNGNGNPQHAHPEHNDVPDHSIFLLAHTGDVDYETWGAPLRIRLADGPRYLFPIDKEELTFLPEKTNTIGQLNDIPQISEFCDATFNPKIINQPNGAIGALVTFRGGQVSTIVNETGARIVRLSLPEAHTIQSTSFHAPNRSDRKLVVKGSRPIVIANLVLPDAFTGQPDEVHHAALYCDLLEHSQPDGVMQQFATGPGLVLREIDQLSVPGSCIPTQTGGGGGGK